MEDNSRRFILPQLKAKLNDISKIINDLPVESQAKALGEIESLALNLKGQIIKGEQTETDDVNISEGLLTDNDMFSKLLEPQISNWKQSTENLNTADSCKIDVQQDNRSKGTIMSDIKVKNEFESHGSHRQKGLSMDVFVEEVTDESFFSETGIDLKNNTFNGEKVLKEAVLPQLDNEDYKNTRNALKHDVKKKERCLVCRKKCTDKNALKEHMQKIHKIKLDLTSKKTDDDKNKIKPPNLTKPIKKEDLTKEIVPESLEPLLTVDEIKIDAEKDCPPCYQCPYCEKLLSREKGLKQHMTRFHSSELSTKCELCKKSYSSYKNLVSHQRIVHGDRKHYCDQCNYNTKHSLDLKRHIIRVHGTKDDYPYQCDVCGKKFVTSTSLRKHSEVHDEGRPFQHCSHEKCEFKTRSTMSMTIHLRNKHQGKQKYFVCEFCGKSLGAKATYETHIRRHKAQYIFRCIKCTAAFPCRTQLAAHAKIHGDKEYECKICNKKFNAKPKVQRHMIIHTGEKKHVCPWCPYKCNLDSNLRKHCISRHNVEFPPKRRPVVRLELKGELPVPPLPTVHQIKQNKLISKEDKVELILTREHDGSVDTEHIVKFLESQDFYGQQAVQVEVAGQTFIISNKKQIVKDNNNDNNTDTGQQGKINNSQVVVTSEVKPFGAHTNIQTIYTDKFAQELKEEKLIEEEQHIKMEEELDNNDDIDDEDDYDVNENVSGISDDSQPSLTNVEISDEVAGQNTHVKSIETTEEMIDGEYTLGLSEAELQQMIGNSGTVVVVQQPNGSYQVQHQNEIKSTTHSSSNIPANISTSIRTLDLGKDTLEAIVRYQDETVAPKSVLGTDLTHTMETAGLTVEDSSNCGYSIIGGTIVSNH